MPTTVTRRRWHLPSLFLALALIGFVSPVLCAAQTILPSPLNSTVPTSGKSTLTKTDVDGWLDGYMPYALASSNVAGAVVVVVKDGHVLTEKGYGYSDVATKRPMDPFTTLVRPASTSKLFTWTAVMQQVQAGKIDLDRDVNDYLDFKIPPYDGKPVTMRNLMTHTAGFEERLEGLLIHGNKPPPLSDAVKAWVPKRIFSPGTTPAYSNYGAMLAGYIVERVSGEPYDEYIARHIFHPLGMMHSTMSEPVPARFVPFLSKGYDVATQPPGSFEMTAMRPAGSATATADDMARFMLANLDEANNPLLKQKIAHEMHTTALTIIPPLNRMDLGFYEHNIGSVHIIAHGGDSGAFHSYLWLLPAQNIGMFFSMNSRGEGMASESIREGLIQNFVARYFPPVPTPVEFRPRSQDDAALSGGYVLSRRSDSDFLRLFDFLDQVTVTTDNDGKVQIEGDLFAGLSGKPRNWIEIAPFVWKDRTGTERFAAQLKDGSVVRIATDSWSPFMVFDRLPWYETKSWLQLGIYASLAALFGLILSLPAGAVARKYYRGSKRLEGDERKAYLLSWAAAVGTIVIAGAWLSLVLNLSFARLPTWVYALQIATMSMPVVLCLSSVWFLWTGFLSKRALFNVGLRTFLFLISVWIVWFVIAFNFAHIGLNY